MNITPTELRIAADRAEVYPKKHAYWAGYDVKKDRSLTIGDMNRHPRLFQYG
jgi:hypothetical protein